jgi:hypothetical protein
VKIAISAGIADGLRSRVILNQSRTKNSRRSCGRSTAMHSEQHGGARMPETHEWGEAMTDEQAQERIDALTETLATTLACVEATLAEDVPNNIPQGAEGRDLAFRTCETLVGTLQFLKRYLEERL